MGESLREVVRSRAKARCEYCHIPEGEEFVEFELDHIIAQKHKGSSSPDNLAFSCYHCNSFKGPNIAGFDLIKRRVVRLFNPRKDRWNRHFRWDGPILIGMTAIGRVTVEVLNINHSESVELRELKIEDINSP